MIVAINACRGYGFAFLMSRASRLFITNPEERSNTTIGINNATIKQTITATAQRIMIENRNVDIAKAADRDDEGS